MTINRVGSMFTVFFSAGPVTDYTSAKTSDTAGSRASSTACCERGVYLPPSQFEAAFVSLAHGEREIDATVPPRPRPSASRPDGRRQGASPRSRSSIFRYSRFFLTAASGSRVA